MKDQNLFTKETICMKCQNLFSGKIKEKENNKILSADFLPRALPSKQKI